MSKKDKKKKSLFIKGYFIYLGVLIILSIGLIITTYKLTIDMRDNTPEIFIKNYLTNNLTDDKIDDLFVSNEVYESKDNKINNIKEFLKNGKYDIKRNKQNVYDIVFNNEKILTVYLKSTDKVRMFLILGYDKLHFEKLEVNDNKELYNYEITIPSDYKLLINKKEAVTTNIIKIDGFADAENYIKLPSYSKYIINNLTKEPNIEIFNGNEKVKFKKNRIINLKSEPKKYNTLEEAGINFDGMKFAKDYSLFLTGDLESDINGINTYFVPNSRLYENTKTYRNSLDFSFTKNSRHTIKGFSNEAISNVVVYSDEAFKYDVHFDKTMHVDKTGAPFDKVDNFNNSIYVIKLNGEYKVINIRGTN